MTGVPNLGQIGASSQTGVPSLGRKMLLRGPGLKRKPGLDPKLARLALVAGLKG